MKNDELFSIKMKCPLKMSSEQLKKYKNIQEYLQSAWVSKEEQYFPGSNFFGMDC